MKIYNKLVRDKILKIMKQNYVSYKYHIAVDDNEYISKLYEKLTEEINEFKETPNAEELADILEVLNAIAKFHEIDSKKIKEIKFKKKNDRGAFHSRIILESIK